MSWRMGGPWRCTATGTASSGVNAKDAVSGDGTTEFGRVVERLDIALINAATPQAKGRAERANQTLQDRLVKEKRLAGISSINASKPSRRSSWPCGMRGSPSSRLTQRLPTAPGA